MSNFQSNQRMFLMAQVCHDNRHVQYNGGYQQCSYSIQQPQCYYDTCCSNNQQQDLMIGIGEIAAGIGAIGVSIAEIISAAKNPASNDCSCTCNHFSDEELPETSDTQDTQQAPEPTLDEKIEALHKKLQTKSNDDELANLKQQKESAETLSALDAQINALHLKLHPEEAKKTASSNSNTDNKPSEKTKLEKALKTIDYSESKKAYADAVDKNDTDKIEAQKNALNKTLDDIKNNKKTINDYLKAHGADGDGSLTIAEQKKANEALKALEKAEKDIQETLKTEAKEASDSTLTEKGLQPADETKTSDLPVFDIPKSSETPSTSTGSTTSTAATTQTSSTGDKTSISNKDNTTTSAENKPVSTPFVPVESVSEPVTVTKPAETSEKISINDAKAAAKEANKILAQTHNLEDQRTAIKAYNTWAKSIINGEATNWQLNDCITSMEILCHPLNNDSIFVRDLITESNELLATLKDMQFQRYLGKGEEFLS